MNEKTEFKHHNWLIKYIFSPKTLLIVFSILYILLFFGIFCFAFVQNNVPKQILFYFIGKNFGICPTASL
jgi:hypothetical protein